MKLFPSRLFAWLLPAVVITTSALAQQKVFTKEELLSGRLPQGIIGTMPQVVGWKSDKELIINYRGNGGMKVMDVTTGTLAAYTAEAPKENGTSVSIRGGDIFLRTPTGEKQLTKTEAEEHNAMLSPDNSKLAFTRSNNLYAMDLALGKEVQLTTDGSDLILNGYASWVYWEEIFGRATAFRAFWWSPDSKTIAYMRFDQSGIDMFPLYNSNGTHGFLEETRYPKAGDPNPKVKLGFVSPMGGSTRWVDFNDAIDHQLGWPEWKPDGSALFVQWQNRGQDHLVMYAVNGANTEKKIVYEEKQSAWISLDEADDRLTFINDGKEMIIRSDKTGWKHMYLYGTDGQFKNAITTGDYSVTDVLGIDEKNRVAYVQARGKENSARNDVYRVSLDGKKMQRITFGEYNHMRVEFSPNYQYYVTTYSNAQTPYTTVVANTQGKVLQRLGTAIGETINDYAIAKTELIRIKSADGKYDLPAMVTWPANYDPAKKYPMLVNVYGGPDATNVMDSWNWNAQRQWYAQEGLLQVSFDNRASGHFGKNGITEIHRQMGIKEIEDFRHMAQYFISKGVADPARVCITGFSFGGYMTCMALTYAADVFTHGMAGGSVTDWHLYDNHYTERYMDTPAENPEGYKKTSVMTYANQYKGMLQIVHGTMDDNVHVQNSIQLIGALQDAGKDFELMLYPDGRHGWRNLPKRNAHFSNLKTKFIYQYLLQKAPPAEILQ